VIPPNSTSITPTTTEPHPISKDQHMKLVTAIIKPFKLDDVKDALKAPASSA
jgi:hypothetical protein